MARGNSSKPFVSILPTAAVQIQQMKLDEESSTDEEFFCEELSEKFSYGLIVGQCPKESTDQPKKDASNPLPMSYILFFSRTPVEVKDEDEDEAEDEDEPMGVQSLEEVDPDWVMEHAKRVSLMLPGGIRILGMFVSSEQESDSVFKSPIVRKTLQSVDKVLNVDKKSSNYFIFHVNKKKSTHACELVASVDGVLSKNQKGVDVENVDEEFRWQRISSKFLFDYPIVFRSGEESEQTIAKKVKESLQMVENNLNTSNILFNNQFRSKSDDFLDTQLKVGKKSPRKSGDQDEDDDDEYDAREVKDYTADILLDPEFQTAPADVEVLNISSRMRLSGRMAVRAFLHPQAKVGEAIEAVKEDLIRSLSARCDMHCDSLVGEEVGGAGDEIPVLHEPPRRVLIKLPKSEVTISDFLFPGEATEASVKAVLELFGFLPELEDLDDEQELVASPKQVVSSDGEDKAATLPDNASTATTSKTLSSTLNAVNSILSVLVVLAGIALTYFYVSTPVDDDDTSDVDLDMDSIRWRPPPGGGDQPQ